MRCRRTAAHPLVGRATAGRATAGRAINGRAINGRAINGRATAGRASADDRRMGCSPAYVERISHRRSWPRS